MDNTEQRSRLLHFYKWLAAPGDQFDLEMVLHRLRDEDLIAVMQERNSPEATTLAWAEYGRRHTGAKINFTKTAVDVIEVEVTGVTFGGTVGLA